MEGALLLIIGGLVGACATGFVQDRWRRIWERETDAHRRAAVRSEEAADALLPLLDQIRTALPAGASWDSDLDDELLDNLATELNRLAVKLGEASARARVEDIALSITHTNAIANMMGVFPGKVGWRCHKAGRNVVAHVLGGEALETESVVDDYRAAIEEYYTMQADAEDASRRSAGSPDD